MKEEEEEEELFRKYLRRNIDSLHGETLMLL